MNLYEDEMREMFGNSGMILDAKFSGRAMIGKLDRELRVKLQLISTHIAGQYDAVQAVIINRTEGMVDRQTFRFEDIIGRQKRVNGSEIEPHIWEYGGNTEWYIPITTEQKAKISDAVLGYIGMYQNDNMETGGMQQ